MMAAHGGWGGMMHALVGGDWYEPVQMLALQHT